MELLPEYQSDPAALPTLYPFEQRTISPLRSVQVISRGWPLTVIHFAQLPAVTISFNLAPDVSLGTAGRCSQQGPGESHLPAT